MLNDLIGRIWGVLAWLYGLRPHWAVGTVMLVVAGLIALSLCRFVVRLLRRLARRFGPIPDMLLKRSENPSCALLVVMAVGVALPLAPFSAAASDTITHLLLIAFILIIGWSAVKTLDMFSDLYERQSHMDVEDNLKARKRVTQVLILRGAARTLIVLLTLGIALMTSSSVRQYGVSLFASAGAAGLVVGLAARPVLTNLLAGIQIAITQPIRLEDAVVVEGEWGWIERIASTYVVIRIWDLRRLIVPLSYFIETPFRNWTYENADLLGTVFLYVDYTVPVEKVRAKVSEFARASERWDGKVAILQVTDATAQTVELRALVSAHNGPLAFDLRCEIREKLLDWLQREYPGALPTTRVEMRGVAMTPAGAMVSPEMMKVREATPLTPL
jgi:small-conductance mechanosensitive channel